ncbi:hypothetical protein [Bacillus solimangrovi]|uniref:Uncharacterized protein n=1 Tax=Bacillus solimangrovi TaxID=1305675 RepID=A0A1E5LAI4_9BACI|nr:hypothetical protein [Bacillus solimangrovi]OEH91065.1 hypothetical protein BFG57_06745 [Bacillus solimangrovi]
MMKKSFKLLFAIMLLFSAYSEFSASAAENPRTIRGHKDYFSPAGIPSEDWFCRDHDGYEYCGMLQLNSVKQISIDHYIAYYAGDGYITGVAD